MLNLETFFENLTIDEHFLWSTQGSLVYIIEEIDAAGENYWNQNSGRYLKVQPLKKFSVPDPPIP